jgi:5-methylcytosine-specific restriction endonuclease McrA
VKRAPLKRSKGLKRTASKPKVRVPRDYTINLLQRQAGLCPVCDRYLTTLQVHHILPQSKWPEHAENLENMVALHPHCHANHEAASRRIRQSELREETLTWVRSLGGLEALYLERIYPTP